MPAAHDALIERLKQHPEIRNPYAMANYIEAHRRKAAMARHAHREKMRREGREEE